eukprot:2071907-Amphidinium_carterae.1
MEGVDYSVESAGVKEEVQLAKAEDAAKEEPAAPMDDLPDFDDTAVAVVSDGEEVKREPVLDEGATLGRTQLPDQETERNATMFPHAVGAEATTEMVPEQRVESVTEVQKENKPKDANLEEVEHLLMSHMAGHTTQQGDLHVLVESVKPALAKVRQDVTCARQAHYSLFNDVVGDTWDEMWHASFMGRKKRREAIELIVWREGDKLTSDLKSSKRGLWESIEAIERAQNALAEPWQYAKTLCYKTHHAAVWNGMLRTVGLPWKDVEVAPRKATQSSAWVESQSSSAKASKWQGHQWWEDKWEDKWSSKCSTWKGHQWWEDKWSVEGEKEGQRVAPPPPPPARKSQLGTEESEVECRTSDADATEEKDDESGSDETWTRREQETIIAARVRTEVARQLHQRERAFKRTSDESGVKATHTGWNKFGLLEKIEHSAKTRRIEPSDQSEKKSTPPWRREKSTTSWTVPPPPVPVVPTEQSGGGEQPHEWTWPPAPPVVVGQGQVIEPCGVTARTTPVPPLAVRAPGGGFRKLPNPPKKK